MSKPSISWSSVTRRPVIKSTTFSSTRVPTSANPQAIEHAYKLVTNLTPVSIAAANRFRCAKNRVDHLRRKHTSQERTDGSSGAVHAKRVERVIIPEDCFDARYHPVAADAGHKSNHQCWHRRHKSCRGRDGHQPC